MSEPWILHEDDHLLAVNKPAGVNTHQVEVNAQQGIHEWAQDRAGRELGLAHRLDKGTSGVLLMGKTEKGNKLLAERFEAREVHKRYAFLCKTDPRRRPEQVCDASVPDKKRDGEDLEAVTEFSLLEQGDGVDLVEARPLTGRTHQVRLHAARLGMPILGDTLYQGPPGARLFLHAAGVTFRGRKKKDVRVKARLPLAFREVLGGTPASDPFVAARAAQEARLPVVGPDTDAYLWIDRDHDGFPDLRVERLGDVGVALRNDTREGPLNSHVVNALMRTGELKALVEQRRLRKGRGPFTVVAGQLEAERFTVRELGLNYTVELSDAVGSSGLFLDQRENRRRLLTGDLAGKTVLNAFAHTGSLSVAAAKAGAETLTLDLSKRYLEWAKENLQLNGLDPAEHDFVYGDALDWLARFVKKGRTFDRVLLDPPSFSTGRGRRKTKTWSVERDLGRLVELGAKLTAPGGELLVSTNLRRLAWPRFAQMVQSGLDAAGRQGLVDPGTVPLDHRCGAGDPPYLKWVWISL